MWTSQVPIPRLPAPSTFLTTMQFQDLAAIPPELEWLANLINPNTRRTYEQDIRSFQAFPSLLQPEQFPEITRAHAIAWRAQLARQGLANATLRRELAVLLSLHACLRERPEVWYNPALGVKRPRSMTSDGLPPALGGYQARMLQAPRRAAAATTALAHDPDIAQVQEWLGHAGISTARTYNKRQSQPEDTPMFKVRSSQGDFEIWGILRV
jgi:site-specific recombinase XerC